MKYTDLRSRGAAMAEEGEFEKANFYVLSAISMQLDELLRSTNKKKSAGLEVGYDIYDTTGRGND